MNYGWPIAFAFVGLCAAIAYATVYAPAPRSAQIACIEQRGKWIPDPGWRGREMDGTCEFPAALGLREEGSK